MIRNVWKDNHEYINLICLQTIIAFWQLSLLILYINLKILYRDFGFNESVSFSPHARIIKITVILQFSCPCARISTLFYPIVLTVVDVGIFKYIGISSIFEIAHISK